MKDKFYETEKDQLSRIKKLVSELDPLFVAKLALFARNEYGMRSSSHVLAGEVAKKARGVDWTRNFFDKIVRRPDDMGEIIAYYKSTEDKLTNPIRDGFARAIARFDEYQLAKYRGEGKGVKLVDVVNLCHPKNTEAIKKLVNGTLKSTETWEAKISASGKTENVEASKAAAWRDLIQNKKIGYMALLKNLRNIIQQSDEETIDSALDLLVDKESIKNSLVLPFRFLTAYKELSSFGASRDVISALSTAMEISLDNVPGFDGKTLIALDTSGSMTMSKNGEGITPCEIGSLFAAAFYKKLNSDLCVFNYDTGYVSLNPMDSLVSISKNIPFSGGGTNFHSIFQRANKAYDRIIILSDMQGWIGSYSPASSFAEYKNKYNCSPFVYSFDLQGYGTTQLPTDKNVFLMAGFSDKVFDTMKFFEEDKNALINKIESIEI